MFNFVLIVVVLTMVVLSFFFNFQSIKKKSDLYFYYSVAFLFIALFLCLLGIYNSHLENEREKAEARLNQEQFISDIKTELGATDSDLVIIEKIEDLEEQNLYRVEHKNKTYIFDENASLLRDEIK